MTEWSAVFRRLTDNTLDTVDTLDGERAKLSTVSKVSVSQTRRKENTSSGVPIAVCRAALASLDPDLPPADVPPKCWARFLEVALRFLASDWAQQAIELGWTAHDLFGCHPITPFARHDYAALLWSLSAGRGRLVAMTAKSATIETPTKARLTYYRTPAAHDAVLPWELLAGAASPAICPRSPSCGNR